jgi:hypothetical protein
MYLERVNGTSGGALPIYGLGGDPVAPSFGAAIGTELGKGVRDLILYGSIAAAAYYFFFRKPGGARAHRRGRRGTRPAKASKAK